MKYNAYEENCDWPPFERNCVLHLNIYEEPWAQMNTVISEFSKQSLLPEKRELTPKTLRSTLFSKYLPWKLHDEWKPFSKLVRGFRYVKRFISSQGRMCGGSSGPSCVTPKICYLHHLLGPQELLCPSWPSLGPANGEASSCSKKDFAQCKRGEITYGGKIICRAELKQIKTKTCTNAQAFRPTLL